MIEIVAYFVDDENYFPFQVVNNNYLELLEGECRTFATTLYECLRIYVLLLGLYSLQQKCTKDIQHQRYRLHQISSNLKA